MSLFEELIEDRQEDEKIVKSFQPKDTLSNQIFDGSDGSYVMRDDIRKSLMKISDAYMDSLGIEFFIHDIVLTGSLANYNWSKYSDVDLHIIIDFEETNYPIDLLKEFFDSKEREWKSKHNIKIKGFDVELYIQDYHQKHVSSGVYSILNNKWVIKPERETPNIDDNKILQKGEEYAKKIDSLVKRGKTQNVLDELVDLKKKIKSFRQSGLEKGGEYSYENLTFKLLRRNGYMEKLLKLKTDITDKKLSITQ